jgi:hypothetical protein
MFNNFVFKTIFLFNNMIKKIDARKIEHQANVEMFYWDCDNLIRNKVKKLIQNQSNFKR